MTDRAKRIAHLARSAIAALLALAAGLALTPDAARAYEVAPIVYELKPSGSGAATMLRITNNGVKPLTIEVTAERRDFDADGVESRSDAEDDFLLYPPQAVVPAGKAQSIRVQYIGNPALSQSASYLVTVRQVPVALPGKETSVQVVFNFATLASVVPANARTDVRFVGLEQGPKGPRLHFRNEGTRHGNLATSKVTLGGLDLTQEQWRKALGSGWIMPGKDRYVPVHATWGAIGPNASVRFEYVEPQF